MALYIIHMPLENPNSSPVGITFSLMKVPIVGRKRLLRHFYEEDRTPLSNLQYNLN